jgi:hypothetical protein
LRSRNRVLIRDRVPILQQPTFRGHTRTVAVVAPAVTLLIVVDAVVVA